MCDGDEDDEDTSDGRRCLGELGLRVQRVRCSTCIFRPGNLMHLNAGRLADLKKRVNETQSYVTCHQTLSLPDEEQAICRGSFDQWETQIIQLAKRMGFVEFTDISEGAM